MSTRGRGPDADGLVPVQLLRFNLPLYQRTQEHFDAVLREFTALSVHTPPSGVDPDVPARLLEMFAAFSRYYANVTAVTDLERDAAIEEGDTEVDLTYHGPPAGREDARRLLAALDDADEYCRRVPRLRSLVPPADVVAFRQWYFQQFIDQLDGGAPTPWVLA